MFKFHRSPDEGEGGGFESLTNSIDFNIPVEATGDGGQKEEVTTKEEVVVNAQDAVDFGSLPYDNKIEDKKTEEEIESEDGGFKLPEEEGEEKKEAAEEKTENKAEEKEKEKEEEEKEVTEFKLPEEAVNWLDLAKEDGLELTENSSKAFKEAIKNKYEQELNSLPDDAKDYIDHVKNGGKIEDFKEPFAKIDSFLALSDEELVQKDLELTEGWTDEMIEQELAMQIDNDTISHNAKKLRLMLEQNKKSIKEDIMANQKAKVDNERELISLEIKKENDSIYSALDEFKEFMGVPMNQKQKEYIKKKWDDGTLKKEFSSNAKDVIEFASWKYFGKQGQEILKKEYSQKGKDELRAKLSNVPLKVESPGRIVQKKAEDNDFSNIRFE